MRGKMFDYTEEIRKHSAFVKLLGLSIEKLENGFCQSRLQIREEFLNKRKIVHGGVIYSMADISMGVAVYSTLKKEEETATIEIKINYLKPANKKVLVCDARVIQRGKQIAVIEAEVKSDDDQVIAKAIGTFSIIKHKEQ
jgi:acyl-CoA thioesterase